MSILKIKRRIMDAVFRANRDFLTLQPGDRILVSMSGGKDSFGLLWALLQARATLPYHMDLVPFHLDQGHPDNNPAPLKDYLKALNLEFECERQDTFSRVKEKTLPGKSICSLCARFRRAILYKAATRHGCNKVALGHHREDLIETLMLNILFSGQIKSMPPRLRSDSGFHEVIRPLCYAHETDLDALSQHEQFPILPPPNCGIQNRERAFVKKLFGDLSKHSGHIKGNVLAALGQIHLTHLLDKRTNPHLMQRQEPDI